MVPIDKLSQALSGSYVVERQIGRGGSASVYLAHDVRHDRDVAIKVLDPAVATSVGADRFLREIRTTARLNHPHILPLHDSGEADGILYCVMPYVEGETLRELLKRETRLPVPDVLRIAEALGDALAYAHAHGLVHRDIKPENVLIGHGGHCYLSDFGLARAVHKAGDDRLTGSGVALGTPRYISPEQASGYEDIGPRSDIYSLGCLLYELITGHPPFEGQNIQALFAAHISAEPKPLRSLRPEVPDEVERIVHDSLAKDPKNRPHAEQFIERVRVARGTATDHGPLPIPVLRYWRLALGVTAALILIAVLARDILDGGGTPPPALPAADTSRYVVFPFAGDTGEPQIAVSLASSMGRWEGVDFVDWRILQDALRRVGGEPGTIDEASRIARGLGAGRFVLGSLLDDARPLIEATVYDATASPTAPVGDRRTVPFPAEAELRQATVRSLADSLLFPGIAVIDDPIRPGITGSAPALRSYAHGHDALRSWRLDEADSAFARAVAYDVDFGEAYLWLAQVRGWASDDPVDLGMLARQARNNMDADAERYGRLAEALTRISDRDFPGACNVYRTLADRDDRDFVAWYGLGECMRGDALVLPDRASPSGYAFRSSYHAALEAYEHAFLVNPAMLAMFSTGSYQRLLDWLWARSARMRLGFGPDSTGFFAFPGWAGDSLVFIPYTNVDAPSSEVMLRTYAEAVRRNQRRFQRLTRLWVQSQPSRPEALEAQAIALATLRDRGALAAFGRARAAAADSVLAVRIAAEETWVRLRESLPDDQAALRWARGTADSLLERTRDWPAADRQALASLAALTTRCEASGRLMAANAAEDGVKRRWGEDVVMDSQRLLAYAALAIDADSLASIENRVLRRIAAFPPMEREAARSDLLTRAVLLAFPMRKLESLDALAANSPLLGALLALDAGDSAAARRGIDTQLAGAAAAPAGQRTLDAVFTEAWLLDRLGRTADAAAHIDQGLTALELGNPLLMGDPIQVASLLRALCLRIDIGNRPEVPRADDAWLQAVRILAPERSGNPMSPQFTCRY